MISTEDIKTIRNFDTTSVKYSYDKSFSTWDGSQINPKTTELEYFFNDNSKTELTQPHQNAFDFALDLWGHYTVFSFAQFDAVQHTGSPQLVAYNANVDNVHSNPAFAIPEPHAIEEGQNIELTTGVTRRVTISDTEYSGAEIAIDESRQITTLNNGFDTALHEIGHALGLKGDHSLGPEYTSEMTVMSYTYENNRHSITPMALDILAIEQKYGATQFRNTTNDTYEFESSSNTALVFNGEKRSQTIMDTGGTDHFDLSDFTGFGFALNGKQFDGVFIDVRQAIDGQGNWTGHHSKFGGPDGERVYIAHNTIIEQITGSAKKDYIIGNGDTVLLDGGDDNDVIRGVVSGAGPSGITTRFIGGDGDDFYFGTFGDAELEGGEGDDTYAIEYSGSGIAGTYNILETGTSTGDTVFYTQDFQFGFTNTYGVNEGIEFLQVADGTRFEIAQIGQSDISQTQGVDQVTGTAGQDQIFVSVTPNTRLLIRCVPWHEQLDVLRV